MNQESPPGVVSPSSSLPWVTIALLGANLAMFVFGVFNGLDWLKPDPDRMIELGGNLAPLTLSGEPWRMLTSIFMHGGAIHLAVNMYMLIMVGPIAERMFGRIAFGAIYLAAGLAGAWMSTLWNWQHEVPGGLFGMGMRLPVYLVRPTVSIGASGALMGIAGALFAARMIEHLRDYVDTTPGFGKAIGQVILINLGMGFVITGIDQAAHVGGLLGGLALGAVVMGVAPDLGLRRAIVGIALGAALGAGLYGHVASVKDEGVAEFRAQYTEQRREEQAERDAAQRRAAMEAEIAADEARPATSVSADEARGVVIALGTEYANDLALSADGQRAYVSDGKTNALLVVDLAKREVLRRIAGPAVARTQGDSCSNNVCSGVGAAGVAVSRDERFAYVASMQRDALSIVDLAQGSVIASVPVGRYPRRVFLAPDGALALVFNGVDNTYTVVDLERRQALGPAVALPGGDAAQWPFGRRLTGWTAKDGQIVRLIDDLGQQVVGYDFAKRAALPDLSLANMPVPAVAPLDDAQWLVFDRNAWSSVDPRTGQARTLFQNCRDQDVRDALLSADGLSVALIDQNGDTVRRVKRSTGRTIGLYPVPDARRIFALPDGRHWLVLGAENLVILDPDQSVDFRDEVQRRDDLYCRV